MNPSSQSGSLPTGSAPKDGSGSKTARKIPPAPYKGLVPYTEEDAALFFGRDAERSIIIANLRSSRFTLLYGPSGVGKSSVVSVSRTANESTPSPPTKTKNAKGVTPPLNRRRKRDTSRHAIIKICRIASAADHSNHSRAK